MGFLNTRMDKLLPYIIVVLLGILVSYITWTLKPNTFRNIKGNTVHDTIRIPADSSSVIKEALQGMEVGTYSEMVKKFGKIIYKTITKDSLNILDSLRITDSTVFRIVTLSASDTFRYSGYDLLNEDTAKVDLRVRTTAKALLEPINAIQIATAVDSINITVPPRPERSSLELAIEYWEWLLGVFLGGYLLGK